MGYYIDLEKTQIETYGEKLKKAYLPPSRIILRESTDEIFAYFKSIGISNVKDLIVLLKKKDSISELQKTDLLTEEYLKILLRELNSILPKPNKIKEFQGLSVDLTEALAKIGVNNTLKLYDKVLTEKARKELAKKINIPYEQIVELTKLTDLSRIKWVGVSFAKMLYHLGIDSVEKASKANAEELHKQINQLNKEQGFYKANIGINDIRIFVEAAKEVPIEIQY